MRFHSSIADDESTDDAASRVIEASREALAGQIDLGFVFFTDHHRKEAERLIERLWLELDPQCLVGCSAEGVIGVCRKGTGTMHAHFAHDETVAGMTAKVVRAIHE